MDSQMMKFLDLNDLTILRRYIGQVKIIDVLDLLGVVFCRAYSILMWPNSL